MAGSSYENPCVSVASAVFPSYKFVSMLFAWPPFVRFAVSACGIYFGVRLCGMREDCPPGAYVKRFLCSLMRAVFCLEHMGINAVP